MQGQGAPQQQQAGVERIPASLRRRRAAAAAAAAVEAAAQDTGSEADSEVIAKPCLRNGSFTSLDLGALWELTFTRQRCTASSRHHEQMWRLCASS